MTSAYIYALVEFFERFIVSYVSIQDNQRELAKEIPDGLQTLYKACGHRRIIGAFDNMVMVVYRTISGKPKVDALIKVVDLQCDSSDGGATVMLVNTSTGEDHVVGYVPELLFGLPVFISLPVHLQLTWGLHAVRKERQMRYGLFVHQIDNTTERTDGNTYVLPLKAFREEFPECHVDPTVNISYQDQ